jgi:ABC-type glutathione transport system ATPase component
MQTGRFVENGVTQTVVDNLQHAYTRSQLAARPHLTAAGLAPA